MTALDFLGLRTGPFDSEAIQFKVVEQGAIVGDKQSEAWVNLQLITRIH